MVRPCVRDDKPGALASAYRPYKRTNHTLTCLLHNKTLQLVHLWVSDAEHLKGAINAYMDGFDYFCFPRKYHNVI